LGLLDFAEPAPITLRAYIIYPLGRAILDVMMDQGWSSEQLDHLGDLAQPFRGVVHILRERPVRLKTGSSPWSRGETYTPNPMSWFYTDDEVAIPIWDHADGIILSPVVGATHIEKLDGRLVVPEGTLDQHVEWLELAGWRVQGPETASS